MEKVKRNLLLIVTAKFFEAKTLLRSNAVNGRATKGSTRHVSPITKKRVLRRSRIICCAAGKSGGHIISNLNWALQRRTNEKLLFFSADSSLDMHILSNREEIAWHLPLSLSLSRRWYKLPLSIFSLGTATIKSFYSLLRHRPSVILSTGGIIAVPVCIAGWFLRIPIELFELNATPGMATRWLSPLAQKIHVCFRSAKSFFPEKKCVVSKYPVGFDTKIAEHRIFGDSEKLTLFIQGGSQGSQFLNEKVKNLVEENNELCATFNIIHQTGNSNFNWKTFYQDRKVVAHVFNFEDNLAPYYQAADLIICRSGAGQLFEAAHFGKPCITIPLEITGNTHQVENALAMEKEYPAHCVVIRQEELTIPHLSLVIRRFTPKSQSHPDQNDQPSAQTSH